jgi:ketosteroid isomerase-like protein
VDSEDTTFQSHTRLRAGSGDVDAGRREQNLAVVQNAYLAVERDDRDGFLADFAEDAELLEPASLPYGGVYRGVAEIKNGIRKMLETWEDPHVDIEAMVAGEDRVCVFAAFRFTGKRTGMTWSGPVIEVWRFRDGKVAQMQLMYGDTHRALEVFGGL